MTIKRTPAAPPITPPTISWTIDIAGHPDLVIRKDETATLVSMTWSGEPQRSLTVSEVEEVITALIEAQNRPVID